MEKLIKKCKQLDRRAQREMMDLISPMLYSICKRYADFNLEQAKDLLQESLIKIFNNMDTCKATEEIPFRAWCKRIAINTALSSKKQKIVEELNTEMEVIYTLPSALMDLHVEDIMNLLQRLPENHRIVFSLAVIDGYSHKEIAGFLNVGESSSRTFLTRAKKALRSILEEEFDYYKKAN